MDLGELRGVTCHVAVLGKIFGGSGPSSFGRQQRLSEITIEPIKKLMSWERFGGPVSPGPNIYRHCHSPFIRVMYCRYLRCAT